MSAILGVGTATMIALMSWRLFFEDLPPMFYRFPFDMFWKKSPAWVWFVPPLAWLTILAVIGFVFSSCILILRSPTKRVRDRIARRGAYTLAVLTVLLFLSIAQ